MRVSGQKLLDAAYALANRTSPNLVKTVADFVLIVLAVVWTWFVCFSQVPNPPDPVPSIIVVLMARLLIYRAFELYRMSWTHVCRHDVIRLGLSALLGSPFILLLFMVLPDPFSLRGTTRPHLLLITEAAFYTYPIFCQSRRPANGFADVSPIRGVIHGGANHRLRVAVTLTPLDQAPADTLPAPDDWTGPPPTTSSSPPLP